MKKEKVLILSDNILITATIIFLLAVPFLKYFGIDSEKNSFMIFPALATVIFTVVISHRIRFNRLEELITAPFIAPPLSDTDQVYREGAKLCSEAEQYIITLVAASGPKAPDYFPEAVAKRLKEQVDRCHQIFYDVYLVFDGTTISTLESLEELKSRNKERMDVYVKAGVMNYVRLHIVDTNMPINFDVLIVDDHNASIGFSFIDKSQRLTNGLVMKNQHKFVADLRSWFYNSIVPHGIPYKEWINRKKTELSIS